MGSEWRNINLGDVCFKIGSGATPHGGSSVYLESGEIALIRSQNIYNDGFSLNGLTYITDEHADQLSNVEVLTDDVLLNITGDSVARCCQVDPNILPARVNQHVAIIRPDSKYLNARYLRYYMISPSMQEMMLSWAGSGGTRNALTKGMIESFQIPAPTDICEQQAIACILGALDDKIELYRQMNQTLEEIAQSIFNGWFVDFDPVRAKAAGQDPPGLALHIADLFPDSFENTELGEIPAKWFIQTLGDITGKPKYGFTAPGNHVEVGPRMLRITDINRDPWINWSSVPYCEIDAQSFSKNRLHHGDLVIARTGATTGENAFIEDPPDAVFASYLIRFRPKDQRYGRYLQYWMRSNAYDSLVKARQAGSTRESLNAQVIAGFPILIPPSLVAEAFGDLVESLRMKLNHNNRQTRTLSELRDTLLPKLISGEFRIPDAERIAERCV
jgi:type I restriction enzyme S subunit